jgi:hypothetical protein
MKATSTFSAYVLFVGALASPLFAQFSGDTTLTSEEFNIRSKTTITYQETLDEFYLCSFGCTFAAHHFLGHGTEVKQDNGSGALVSDTYKWTSLLYQTKYPGSCYSSHSWASFDTYTGSRRVSPDYNATELCVPMPPDPLPGGGGGPGNIDFGGGGYNEDIPCFPGIDSWCSPIVINLENGDYRLTGKNAPVLFDIRGDGHPLLMGWTAAGADEAFLWLDRNHNGKVTSGAELFGNFTPLENGQMAKNGFEALAELDANHDGVIDDRDPIWSQLMLWRDLNHNGISEPNEIGPLSASDVTAIDLHYHWTGRHDSWGNTFRYESLVSIQNGPGHGVRKQPVYDVFFVSVPQ